MLFATFALSTLVANAAAGVIPTRAARDIDYSGVDWTKVDYSGVDWTKIDYTGGSNKPKPGDKGADKHQDHQPAQVQKGPEPSVAAPVPTVVVSAPKTDVVDKVEIVASAVPVKVSAPSTPSTSTSTSASSGGLSDDQQKALDAHNAARAAVNNEPLSWDASLAADAQAWANTIAASASLTHSSGSGQGENLYMQSGSDSPFLNSINSFLGEKSLYSGQAIDSSNFMGFGHYTQAVWKDTKKVGMAVAKAADGSSYVVVRYSPAGNFLGRKPY